METQTHRKAWFEIADVGEDRLRLRQVVPFFLSIGRSGIDARKLVRDIGSGDGKVSFVDFVGWDQKERMGTDPTKTAAGAFKTAESMFAGLARKSAKCTAAIEKDRKELQEVLDAMVLPTSRRDAIAKTLRAKQDEYAKLEDFFDKLLEQQAQMQSALQICPPPKNQMRQLEMCAHNGRRPQKMKTPAPPLILPRLVKPKTFVSRKCPRTAKFRRTIASTSEVNKEMFDSLADRRNRSSSSKIKGSQTARF